MNEIYQNEQQGMQTERKKKAVYSIIDKNGTGRGYWVRLGTAYVNRDQSLSVYLNALPINARLHIRDLPDGE